MHFGREVSVNISWVSMSIQPRSAIREVIEAQPKFAIFSLVGFYALQAIFYAANYWSLGFLYHSGTIATAALVLAPVTGLLWLFYTGWLFQITGRWFGGKASRLRLRLAVACSKIPLLLFLPIWTYFIVADRDAAFILGAKNPSPILINGLSLLLCGWSQILRIQALREVQGFSLARAAANVLLCMFISPVISFFLFLIVRFVYISF